MINTHDVMDNDEKIAAFLELISTQEGRDMAVGAMCAPADDSVADDYYDDFCDDPALMLAQEDEPDEYDETEFEFEDSVEAEPLDVEPDEPADADNDEKAALITQALSTDEGRKALCDAMVAPLRAALNYAGIGRKLLAPQDGEPFPTINLSDISKRRFRIIEWDPVCAMRGTVKGVVRFRILGEDEAA